MKCSRPNCRRRARAHGLCHLHYDHAVNAGVYHAGITDPSTARRHVEWLLAEGMSLQEITRVSGVAWPTLNRIRSGGRILRSSERRVLAVSPSLGVRVAAESKVPALGTRRRLQALVAIGYTTRELSQRLGVEPVTVWRYMNRSERVEVYMARAVDDLYQELHMTPGGSVKARNRAAKQGWAPPLGWENIDDPDETPDVGVRVQVSFSERIQELRELGVTDIREIADRLGIKAESVERQLIRGRAA